MKDVQATLKRIDDQIVTHKQNIARSQVEIMRLQETRIVLMGLAEEDQAAAGYAREERQGVVSGSHAKPMLIVRKTGNGLNSSGNRRGMNDKSKNPIDKDSTKAKVTALLQSTPTAELSVGAIIDRLGIGPLRGKARQPIYQALWELKRDRIVYSPNGSGSYQIAP
jgi:hypothetical protein